jgi:hypothetical protein
MILAVQTLFYFLNKREVIIYNNTYKDSIINNYYDTVKYFEKEKTINKYEYKTDSVIINYMPDSLIAFEIMRSTKRILDNGFTAEGINGIKQGRTLSDGNRIIENATQNVRECNRHDSGYKNSSER